MNLTIAQRSLHRGFTLIELLVVIAIIAVLATMGVAGGQIVIRKARDLQAKAAMKGLEIGIKGYQTDYLRLPCPESTPPTADNTGGYNTIESDGMDLLNILIVPDAGNPPAQNPRQIRFYDPPPAKSGGGGYSSDGGLRDPWGKQGYVVIMDYDGDGKITNPYAGAISGEADELSTSVIIYSAGANTQFEDGGSAGGRKIDDVRSWQ